MIPSLFNVSQICAGDFSTTFLANSTVYTTGYNGDGELGLGDTINRAVPTGILSLTGNATSITCGFHLSLANQPPNMYGWGMNSYGEAGFSAHRNRLYPTWVSSLNGLPITEIAALDQDSYFYQESSEDLLGTG